MKPLESVKKVLTFLYMCPPDENSSKFKKILCVACSFGTITVMALASLSGAVYAIKCMSTDFEKCLFALFHTVATSTLLYMLIAIILTRNKISNIFNSISNIFELASKIFHVLHFIYFVCIHLPFHTNCSKKHR